MSLVFNGTGLNVLRTAGEIAIIQAKERKRTANAFHAAKTQNLLKKKAEIDTTFQLLLLFPNVPSLRDLRGS